MLNSVLNCHCHALSPTRLGLFGYAKGFELASMELSIQGNKYTENNQQEYPGHLWTGKELFTMGGCCDSGCSLDGLRERQKGTLQIVLSINAVMFLVIVAAALYGRSTALLADSLDNLGDALTYGLSLYAVSRSSAVKAKVALFKGGLIFLAAFAVLVQIIYKFFVPSLPLFEVMGTFSLAGLAANSLCLFLLWRHRQADVNMASVWECSRNDIVANLSVFVAAGAVWLTGSGWPDVAIALGLVVFLMRSAFRVLSSAWAELRETGQP